MYAKRQAPKQQKKTMDLMSVIKCILIVLLIFAGYYVVTGSSRSVIKRDRREGFSNNNNTASSSADTPHVVADKSVKIINDSMMNMLGALQVQTGRTSYEGLIQNMDAWTQAKVLASLNAVAAQMIADSSDATSLVSPPSEKTVALMNAINTMISFHGTSLPNTLKYLDNA
jgi:hypothetical protein